MNFLTVDLGTTNIKTGCFDENYNLLHICQKKVEYIKEKAGYVEFDAQKYFENVLSCMVQCVKQSNVTQIAQIVLTGQAESLVVLGQDSKPLIKGISWLDSRSQKQTAILDKEFATVYEITGNPQIIPTWPITKMLWLKENRQEVFLNAKKYLLIKDYIAYMLCNEMYSEMSVCNFSCYFDVQKKRYWQEILNFVQIKEHQLPPLCEPGTVIGKTTPEITTALGVRDSIKVNVGTLDHFAGMIGTGNIKTGIISESTGTVLSLATLVEKPTFSTEKIGCHYGPFKDSYVLLTCCESGGLCLEWFKNNFNISYEELNNYVNSNIEDTNLIFLPYINGSNPPEFKENTTGVFYGITANTTKYQMARAVMQGVAFMLNKNLECYKRLGVKPTEIYSTGGGSKSDYWCKIKADISSVTVKIPTINEAANLGCAIMGCVSERVYNNYPQATKKICIKKEFTPEKNKVLLEKYNLFNDVFQRLF